MTDLPRTLNSHKNLAGVGDKCDASVSNNDFARHVLLTARHQTTLVAIRFWENADKNSYINDEATVISLGVMIKRALVEYLGINDGEIDFGVKQENNAMTLFVFDTNKSGCGYSTILYNLTDCQRIFDMALNMILSYKCSCERDKNASCSACLVDRDSQHYEKKLSKAKALRWLLEQKRLGTPVPTTISMLHPDAKYAFQSAKDLIISAINNPNVTDITLCALDNEIDVNDWNNRTGKMGALLYNALQNGKKIHVKLQYDASKNHDVVDLLKLSKLSAVMVNFDLHAVKSLDTNPSAIIVKDSVSGVKHYFVEKPSDFLNMTDSWGVDENIDIFVEDQEPTFTEVTLPADNDITNLLTNSNTIVREKYIDERITLPLGHLYSQIIVPHLLQNGDEQLIGDILRNKRVTIEYNDNYVTSMLACEILYRLVKELKSIYNFTLENLSLQIYGKPLNNYQWSDYSYIGHSYPSDQERDKYLDFCFESIDIKATISPNNASHSRWLKITTEDGHQVEIRPDHSIAGGWWTRRYRYDDFQSLDDDTVIERSNNEPEILYYLVIR